MRKKWFYEIRQTPGCIHHGTPWCRELLSELKMCILMTLGFWMNWDNKFLNKSHYMKTLIHMYFNDPWVMYELG